MMHNKAREYFKYFQKMCPPECESPRQVYEFLEDTLSEEDHLKMKGIKKVEYLCTNH